MEPLRFPRLLTGGSHLNNAFSTFLHCLIMRIFALQDEGVLLDGFRKSDILWNPVGEPHCGFCCFSAVGRINQLIK
ncbi:hypothetical protein L596_027460 [Steinernema carpocapsae]|uniref:Uncharacterized protein n=1 Tax=Steinernema carpocapsae TaxID=34508 RepID=A0A4U5LVI9_STECR|nr:hypothetical protein L596_027460 [Steinernema carpocapsae]